MSVQTKIPVPASKFAKFNAEDDQRKLWTLVRDVKNRTGKGGDHYAGFKGIVRKVYQMGQDIHSIEKDFERLITIKEPNKKRLPLLCEAFLDQWRKHDYQFFYVRGSNVTIGRLTLKVVPDLGVSTPTGDEISARLWLSQGNVLDRERETFLYLMSEVKKTAQWPANWGFGVWELERDRIIPVTTVTDELRKLTCEKAERFAEMWDELPNK